MKNALARIALPLMFLASLIGVMLVTPAGDALAQAITVKNYLARCAGTLPCDNVLNIGGTLRVRGQGTVTQITSITTGVTLNANSGVITTVSQTIAAAGEAEFTVTDSLVAATDVVIVNVASINGGAGGPFQATISAVAAGSFVIALSNAHAANAGNSVLVLNFTVIHAAA